MKVQSIDELTNRLYEGDAGISLNTKLEPEKNGFFKRNIRKIGSYIKGIGYATVVGLALAGGGEAKAGLINSNSITKDNIEYYMQTDKSIYNLGENVSMLYRVKNLGREDVGLGDVMSDPLSYYKFIVMQDSNQIREYRHATAVAGFESFHLGPYESKEFQTNWDLINDNGTPWILDDDFPAAPGLYHVFGELDLISGERVPVSVQIEIIPEPSTMALVGMSFLGLYLNHKKKVKS